MDKIKRWIINHDDSNLFVISYIALAVILSVAISLFWLVVVVAVHFVFEIIKQREFDSDLGGVLVRSSWELLLDFALILFAFVIALYMDVILGAAGIGAGARAGIQSASKAGTRFAGWQRAIRGFLLSVDDAAQLTKLSKKQPVDNNPSEQTKYGGWAQKWSKGDKFTLAFTILSLFLILAAPLATDNSAQEVLMIILNDLEPFP